MKIVRLFIFFSVFAALFFCFQKLSIPKVFAESYYFPDVTVDMTINHDGSIDVMERRMGDFSGSFSNINWDIPLKAGQNITGIQISGDDGKYYSQISAPDDAHPDHKFVVYKQGDDEHIEAYYSIANNLKTFNLYYHLTGAVKKYRDAAEFNWTVIGENWVVRTDNLQMIVRLPEEVDKNNVYVWWHGLPNVNSEDFAGGVTLYTAKNIPADTFVEIRELFPADVIYGAALPETALNRIKNEESILRDKARLDERLAVINAIVIPLLVIAWIIFWYRIWLKYGKDYEPSDVPKYLQMPPDKLAPALVEALMSKNQSVTTNSFSATILDLVRRKILKFEARQEYSGGFMGLNTGYKYEYFLHKTSRIHTAVLSDFEQSLIDMIFSFAENPSSVSVNELKKNMSSNPIGMKNFFREWVKMVKKAAEKHIYVDEKSIYWRKMFIVCNTILLSLWAVYILVFMKDPALMIGILYLFIMIIFLVSNFYNKWTENTATVAAKWWAFRCYIRDFGHFKDTLPQAVIIWEEILVYGTALGLADKVSKYLPIILQDADPAVYSGWYFYTAESPLESAPIPVDVDLGPIVVITEGYLSAISAFNSIFSSGKDKSFFTEKQEETESR